MERIDKIIATYRIKLTEQQYNALSTEYQRISSKAQLYENSVKRKSEASKNWHAKLTPEERSERAKKAVQARIAKYNQNSNKG